MHQKTIFFLTLFLLLPVLVFAWQPRLRSEALLSERGPAPLVGADRLYLPAADETLIELARRAGVGFLALTHANPGIDPWLPLAGKQVLLPLAAIVPHQAAPGITINLAEMRLYLIWQEQDQQLVRIYPIGIGREGRGTPLGDYRVVNRARNPGWTPPPEIRAAQPELPAVVPPGPDNPLGDYWIGLSDHRIGLHGTNRPYGVGRQVSSGCIRLYPDDIADLFARATQGMAVRIIHQPIKLGRRDGSLYLEVHPDSRPGSSDRMAEVLRQKHLLAPEAELDRDALRRVLQQQQGVPQAVSR